MIKTEAIVLHTIHYRDHSYIVHIFTREQGRINCLVKGSKQKLALSPVLMQPLSLIDIVLDNRANKTFQYIRESSPTSLLNTVPYDPIKNSIALFLSEILHKTLRESDKENALFDFVKESILFFDTTTKGFANFHLVFLIKMTYFLGFFPNLSQFHDGVYFDMLNSQFTEQNNNPHTLNVEETEAFAHLMRMDYDNMQIFSLSRNQRNTILEHILTYYRLHLPEFGTVKSLDILQQLFA